MAGHDAGEVWIKNLVAAQAGEEKNSQSSPYRQNILSAASYQSIPLFKTTIGFSTPIFS
jgi:hypothetical protein